MKHRRKGRIAAWLLTAALLINGTVPGTPFVSRALAAENTVTITPAQSADADPSRTGTGQMTVSLKIKGAIQPSVTLEGWTKGDTPKTPVVTGNTGNGTVTITYQVNKSGAYTSDVPTTAGTHSVKVTIAESEDYLGGEATADFVIAPADTTSQMAITLDIHKHSFTYAANGARITATCGETGGTCDLTGRAVSFTLTAPAKTKDIDSNSAEATLSSTELAAFNQATGLNVSAQDIKYVGRGNTAYAENTTAPTVAGTYTAKVTVGTGENTATATVDYTIASSTTTSSMTITLVIKNTPSVTAPEAKTLTYDGTTQELVTSGSTNDGTIKYAIGDDDTTAPAEDAFNVTVPTRKNAGIYYVWYLVKGNEGYKDVAPACVPVTIAKANAAATAPTANTLTYNGQDQALVSGGATQDGTLQYAIGTSQANAPTSGFGTTIPSGKDAGTYYVWYKVVGDANHNDLAATPVTAEIAKAAITITADDKSTQYGADIAELTYKVSGAYVQGDDLGVTISTTATSSSSVGEYPISLGWNDNANYTATLTNGKYMITRANLTVSASGYSGTYDGQAHGISVGVGDSDAIVYYGITELNNQNYNTAGSTTNPTYTNAGTYTVYYYVKSTNYEPHPLSSHQTVTIAKANVEVTAPSAATLTYDGSDRALVSGGSVTGGSFAYALGENGTTAPTGDHAWNAGVPTGKNAGTYYVWYKGVGDGNHNDAAPACITVTIGKKAATISANAASKTYGDADPTLTANVNGAVGTEVLQYTLSRAVGENVNNYAITVTVEATANPNYDITVNGSTFTINKKSATITANAATKTYGDADPTLTATVTGTVGNDTLNYTLGRTAGENVDGYTITVTANEADNPNYDVTTNNGTFTINKKALTITADSATKVYDTTALTKNSYTNTDLVAGDSIESVTITGSQTTVASSDNVPSAAVIKKSGTDVTANYQITYVNGTLTVTKATTNTVTVDITGWTYGDSANAPTSEASFGANTVTYSYSDAQDGTYTATVPVNAGTWYVKASVAGTANYVAGEATKSFTIAKKALTITADSATKVYDTTALTKNTYTNTALATGDSIESVTITGSQTTAASSANVPSAAVIKKGGTDVIANYEITYVNGTLTVTQATTNTVTVDITGWTYGDSANAPTSEASFGANTVTYSYSNAQDGTYTQAVPTNAGTWYVKASVAGTDNYVAGEAVTSFTINKKSATITANAASKTYGDADPTLTATVTGTVGNDTLNYTLGRTAGENVDGYIITVTANEADNPNYDITTNNGTFTINKKALTITADSATKVYDTTALTKNSYTNTDLVAGDSIESVTITGSQTTVASSANVPSSAVIKKSGTDVTANYEITYVNGTLTVTQAMTNTVTVDITGWTYGDSANAPTSEASFGANTVTYSYSDAQDGTYTATVPVNAGTWYVKASVAGTANYVAGEAVKSFTIAKREVVVSGIIVVDKNYDGTNTASLDFSKVSIANLVAADAGKLSVTATGTFADEKIGKDKKVTISDLALSGDAAGNYVLAAEGQQTNATADISDMASTVSTDGRFRTEVKDFEGFKPQVAGLDLELAKHLCTPAELAAYEAGGKLELELEVGLAGAAMTSEVVELVTNAVKDQKKAKLDGALYLDINLYKVVNGVRTKVTDLNGKSITITLTAPEDMENKIWENRRTFYAVRVHSGVATVLSESNSREIPFATDEFSVYAIAFADVNVITYDTNKTSSATGNNTVTATVVAPKTDGTDETTRTILVFGTAFAVAAIVSRIYVFGRRKEEEE